MKHFNRIFILACLVLAWTAASRPSALVFAQQEPTPTPKPLTPAELIAMLNRVRTGRGLRALIVDPILMGTAQSTADIMAAYSMTNHIGDVRGRVIAAGYGAGDIAWATENFAVLPVGTDPAFILQIWSDNLHMKPMADPNYKHIGAGIAIASEDAVYYIVHAAYTSNGTYKPNQTPAPGAPAPFSISQYIFAVQTATPARDGSLVHVVRQGQSLWSIAIAYQTHIEQIQQLNGIAADNLTIYVGQKLRIPTVEKPIAIKQVAAETAAAVRAQVQVQVNPGSILTPSPSSIAGKATAETPVSAPSTLPQSIPPTGDSIEQVVFSLLITLGILGAALTIYGLTIKSRGAS
jgi:LysM repeat protein/uncharacterized protein YkwD